MFELTPRMKEAIEIGLKENGINIPDNIIDPDEAIEAISKAL